MFSSSIIITYGIHPFDICIKNPELWQIIKILFIFTYIFSSLILSNLIYKYLVKSFFYFVTFIFNKLKLYFLKLKNIKYNKFKNSILNSINNLPQLNLFIGNTENKKNAIYLPEKSLYQNILITGTIGTGNTSSAMYPFTEQLISNKKHLPMLILDVKGNYYLKVKELCQKYNRIND